jgi:hypothetical protein
MKGARNIAEACREAALKRAILFGKEKVLVPAG